jgi:PAS domain-containing protein
VFDGACRAAAAFPGRAILAAALPRGPGARLPCPLRERAALYLVLTPDLTIVAVSDAYAAATMTRRDEILGRGLFEVFPDNPDDPAATGVRNLRASLERVILAASPTPWPCRNTTSSGRVRRRRLRGTVLEPVNTPVLGPKGELSTSSIASMT